MQIALGYLFENHWLNIRVNLFDVDSLLVRCILAWTDLHLVYYIKETTETKSSGLLRLKQSN